VAELCRAGLKGPFHLSIGQEAIAAGVCAALNRDDYILSNHRGLGHFIAKGGNINPLYGRIHGKDDRVQQRQGGKHAYGGPLGGNAGGEMASSRASIPICLRSRAFCKASRSRQVAGIFFGGRERRNNGLCHESMNLAAVWKLPWCSYARIIYTRQGCLPRAVLPSRTYTFVAARLRISRI